MASLPEGFTTPEVAGAALSVGPSSLVLDWRPASGWHWNMAVGAPALEVDGVSQPVGEAMDYSDSSALESLVTDAASTFAPILTGVLGIALYRAQARAGLALNGWFGLLPNLAPHMPDGLNWPDDMPVMTPTSFDDPIGQVRAQVQAILADGDKAVPALQLLAWAITSSAETAPEVSGAGTQLNPYQLDLGLFSGTIGTLWQPEDKSALTLGLGYTTQTEVGTGIGAVTLSTALRLDAFALDWSTGKPASLEGVPSLSCAAVLAMANGDPLVERGGISVQTVGLRVSLNLSASFAVTSDLFLSTSEGERHTLGANPVDVAAMTTLVNAAFQAALASLRTSDQFDPIYGLLSQLGLMIPASGDSAQYGLDGDGWMALTSDGLGFLRTRFTTVLADTDQLADLIDVLKALSGLNPPSLPASLSGILTGLGLVVPGAGGTVVPNPEGIVAMARDPAGNLVQRFQTFMGDEAVRGLVMSTLTDGFQSTPVGPFTFDVRNGRTLSLALSKDNAIALGAFAALVGEVGLDLVTGKLGGTAELFVPEANAGLATSLSAILGEAPVVTTGLTWGDGSVPLPAPLQLYPFDAEAFITSLSEVAPAYALSVFVSRVVEARILPDYPLARMVLHLFGLVEQQGGSSGPWVMKSTLGLFEDPLDWLLSDAVIGADGTLNLQLIQDILTGLPPGAAPGGLTLVSTEMGATVTGLPYGLQVAVTADPSGAGALTITPCLAQTLPLFEGTSLNKLAVGLTLSAACQPGFTLDTDLSADIPGLSNGLSVRGGYDKLFMLSFGESGEGNPSVQLLPFLGWASLVQQLTAAAAQALLPTLTDKVLDGLAQNGAGTLANSLRTAGTNLEVSDLLTKLLGAVPNPSAMEQAALDWLSDRLDPANAGGTARAVVGLFSPYVDGISADDTGLVTYVPSSSIPLTVLAGVRTVGDTRLIGLWARGSVAVGAFATVGLAPTGAGMALPDTTLVPSFGFTVQALVTGSEGPGLVAGLDGGLSLSMDPLMDAGATGDLVVELLPQPFGVPGSQVGDAVTVWLLKVATLALPRYASALVLNTATVRQWLDAPLFPNGSTLTAAQVLQGAQLIVDDRGTYVLNSLTNLMNLGIDGFLAGFLRTLMETQVKILSLPQDGGIWVEPGSTAGSFGLRVQAPDMKLPDTTRFVFQLGASDTEWITLAGGSEDIIERAGVSIYLPIADNVPQFAELQVNLINIGVDFQGSGGQPLMDLTRFKMGAVKPRGLLTMDFAKSSFVTGYGGGFDVADIQISLAPNTAVEGENANPVAQNLMGAGSKASDVANPSVNPGFTLTAGWLNTGHLGVEFRDGEGDPKAELWIPIQRTFGPVHADQIGIGYQNDTNRGSVMFDGSLSLAGLTVELVDLSVSVNFAQITDYTQYSLDLGGLAVSFNGGGVSVAGGLLKKSDPIRYDGMLLVKFSTFSIYAIGSFGLVPVDADKPEGDTAVSFFAFLNLNAPLGGVPEFFIEGIAGGFGINRGLTVPGAGDLMSFPLIQGAISSSYFGEDAGPAKALEKMGDSVPPVVGDYWIAGGFRFSTYKILTVFAMLMVRFGKEFEIDLIGVAQASLPPEVPVDKALAYVELGMVASFKPTEGEISVTAQLTTNSFLLTKSCRLTGGFAAIYWYGSNKNAGDFVITLGGYHPAFDPPDHYPVVPRLGFNWPVIDEDALSLKVYGGAYFALTPSMVMAGAELKASFEAGPLSAWFDAGANFLIAWQPFYYMAEIHISVGAALTVEAFGVKATLSAELGALLELWGPETAGRVKVNWYIIKFTIPFGNQDEDESSTKPLSWDQFVIRMLPSGQAEGGAPASVRAMAVTGAATGKRDDAGADPVILNAQVTQGLLRTEDDGTMVVQARPLEFTLGTAIPATTLSVTGLTGSVSGAAIGVRPMEVTEVTTALVVTFEVKNTQTGAWDAYPVTGDQFVLAGTSKPSPGAMWAREAFDPQGLPSAKAVDNTLTGLTLTSGADVPFNPIGPMDLLEAFGYDQAPILALPFAVTPNYDAAPEYGQTNAFSQMMTSVMAPTVVNERSAIWGAVIDHGLTAITAPNLSILSGFADLIYVAPPAIAPLTQDVLHAPANPATVQVAKVAAMAARTTPEEETVETQARPPRLVGTAKVRSRRGSRRTTAQWRAASVHDTPTAPAAAGVPSSVQARTSAAAGPGDMALFELGTGGVTASLDSHGRARVVEIDHLGRVHADRVVDGGAAVPLSDRTARIALVGTAKGAEVAAGWASHTQVFQAGLHTLIAPGCRIRVQASPRGRHRARELKQTVLSAAEILRRDRVQTAGGGTQSGWVETLFPTVPQAILVAHEGVAPEVRMTARPDAGPRTLGPVVAPISTHDRNGHQVSVYPVPEVEDGAELGVWIAQAEGILGVHASHEAPHGLIAQAMPARAPSFGAPLPRAADVLSQGREVRLKAQAQSVADGVPRATPSGPRAVPSFHLTAA
ncbi:MAG: hypothetical protein K9H11_13395 [Rhodospirillum sp.]|nr:hypothetical protein [Rhodospirillum sp.]